MGQHPPWILETAIMDQTLAPVESSAASRVRVDSIRNRNPHKSSVRQSQFAPREGLR